ncbi:MAG: hypothetical protein L0G71_03095 [Yaniella sp.]|nr:hypothetical protein [Yaniella sp.]
MRKTRLLSTTPPQPVEPVGPQTTTKNPYRKWHIAVYTPTLALTVIAGILGLQVVAEDRYWATVCIVPFVAIQFVEYTISDKLLDGIHRPLSHRIFDSPLTALWLLASLLTPAVVAQWHAFHGWPDRVLMIGLLVIVYLAILVTAHEMGSLGRVVKPKTIEAMDIDVREVIAQRLNENHCEHP